MQFSAITVKNTISRLRNVKPPWEVNAFDMINEQIAQISRVVDV